MGYGRRGAVKFGHKKRVKHKNIHAVILGGKGGKIGGPARASALSSERRSQIARMGGIARTKGN
jgi:hypothetical protein